MLPVVTAAQMHAIDTETIKEIGIPGAVLMENAGRAVVTCVEQALLSKPDARVAVICGPGNNGGDGFVVARVLRERGVPTSLFLAVAPDALRGDAKLHADAFVHCGGVVEALVDSKSIQQAQQALYEHEVLVDALFGTGLARELSGHWKEIVELINAAPATVIAVDVPSGLRADDGCTMGASVSADATVTFACPKVAHAGAPGFVGCGTLHIVEMGIPVELANRDAQIGLLQRQDILAGLRGDDRDSHKGTRGHVLAIAGSEGKYGAGRLAGLAALRAGAGLVTLAAPRADAAAEDPLMTATLDNPQGLAAMLVGKSSLVIGPGMSTEKIGDEMLRCVIQECELPMVVDADGLNHLGTDLALVASATAPVVLTPHPGEAGRLLGIGSRAVQTDRVRAVRELAAKSRAVVVLKGARTCICDGREASNFVAINPTGGPELGTAGTGDILAGIVAALLARGLDACLAARVATYWHGEAGSVAMQQVGGPGIIASDLLAAIPSARADLCPA